MNSELEATSRPREQFLRWNDHVALVQESKALLQCVLVEHLKQFTRRVKHARMQELLMRHSTNHTTLSPPKPRKPTAKASATELARVKSFEAAPSVALTSRNSSKLSRLNQAQSPKSTSEEEIVSPKNRDREKSEIVGGEEEIERLEGILSKLRKEYDQLCVAASQKRNQPVTPASNNSSSTPHPMIPSPTQLLSSFDAQSPIPQGFNGAGHASQFNQRKATLAAFRKASLAAQMQRPSMSFVVDLKGGAEKSTPALTVNNADLYFSFEKRSKTIEDFERITIGSESAASLITQDRFANPEVIQRLRVGIANETRLHDEFIRFVDAILEQDRLDLEQAIMRQTLKLQVLDSQVASLASNEISKLTGGDESSVKDVPLSPTKKKLKNAAGSDSDSSDSDVVPNGKDIELTRMPDGTIRISVGVQVKPEECPNRSRPNTSAANKSPNGTAVLSPPSSSLTITPPNLMELTSDIVGAAVRVINSKEHAMKQAMDSMTSILRQLERINDAFESEIFCLSCRSMNSELYCLWPCGHHYCLNCIYNTEHASGGYHCVECRSVTTDVPVPNIPVNDLISRLNFKRSGVHELFDVINRYRKQVKDIENGLRVSVCSLYVPPPTSTASPPPSQCTTLTENQSDETPSSSPTLSISLLGAQQPFLLDATPPQPKGADDASEVVAAVTFPSDFDDAMS